MNLIRYIQDQLPTAPWPLRNLYYSVRGFIYRQTELNADFRRIVGELCESDWWDAGRIREFQDEQVRWIVRHAYETVPFYREWFARAGVRPSDIGGQDDLVRLPVLTKQVVRENWPRMVSRSYRGQRLIQAGTSGTTGTPIRVFRTVGMRNLQRAIFTRYRARFGMPIYVKKLTFSPHTRISPAVSRPPFWTIDYVTGGTNMSLAHLQPAFLPAIAEFLRPRRYEDYGGWPSAMMILATWMLENGVRLEHPPAIVDCGSETVTPAMRRRLSEAFEAPVHDKYGSVEFAGHMCTCERGRYHLDFECCCVEFAEAAGADADVRNMIFTGWGNPVMPFIRYEVGDWCRLADGPCPCGRGSVAVASIQGRSNDYLLTRSGRRITGIDPFVPGAREVQLRQDAIDHVRVLVVPAPDADRAAQEQAVDALRKLAGEELTLELEWVEAIDRTAAGVSNSKFRSVVCDVAAPGGGG